MFVDDIISYVEIPKETPLTHTYIHMHKQLKSRN